MTSKDPQQRSQSQSDGGGLSVRIGEFAKRAGKSVRAIHLYEELGLLTPARRSKGGFRLYDEEALERIQWIVKLQSIGFTLAEIQGFVRDFEDSPSGRDATVRVRAVFEAKLAEVRAKLAELATSEKDILDALAYLDACTSCPPQRSVNECHECSQQGHEPNDIPPLFAGLSGTLSGDPAADPQLIQLRARPERGEERHGK